MYEKYTYTVYTSYTQRKKTKRDVRMLRNGRGRHIGMPLYCEMVLVKKLELEATELNLKNNSKKLDTPALVFK